MRTYHAGLAILALSLLGAQASALNLLTNSGFDLPPTLGAGQSDLLLGDLKMIETDTASSLYPGSISGVPGWLYRLPDGHSSDQGISMDTRLSPIDGGRHGFINNWNRRFSQTPTVIMANTDIIASIWVGSYLAGPRAARVTLVAGELDPNNFDEFLPSAVTLAEKTAATAQWLSYTPDYVLPDNGWTLVTLTYHVAPNNPLVGTPLTFSFRTEAESLGTVQYDATSLEVVPEPSSIAALGLAAALLLRRFSKK